MDDSRRSNYPKMFLGSLPLYMDLCEKYGTPFISISLLWLTPITPILPLK